MATREHNDRYLYLGGPVETARTRACFLAVIATLLYAGCLFGAVVLAHALADRVTAGQAYGSADIRGLHQN
jgi:hypothetical protein